LYNAVTVPAGTKITDGKGRYWLTLYKEQLSANKSREIQVILLTIKIPTHASLFSNDLNFSRFICTQLLFVQCEPVATFAICNLLSANKSREIQVIAEQAGVSWNFDGQQLLWVSPLATCWNSYRCI
jgi:hypothetical protein